MTTYAIDPALVPERTELEAHLAACAPCQAVLADIHAMEALLADEESWASGDLAEPPEALCELAARRRREDEKAEELLGPLLQASPAAFVWKDIPAKPKYHTAGVVRRLAAEADRISYSNPRHALNLAESAIAVAGMLLPQRYTPEELAAVHGLAWKQRANALRHLGRYREVPDALARAEQYFRRLPRPELDSAGIDFIRATIYTEQQDYALAERYASASAATFAHLGQTELYFRSRFLEGVIAFERRELARAEAIFEAVCAHADASGNRSLAARAALALGNCALERADLTMAARLLHTALVEFRSLGIRVAEHRCRWGLAMIARRDGRLRTAIARLQEVRNEFVAMGTTIDAALVTLDLMETFLETGDAREVQRAAGNIVTLLREQGIYTGAMTAAEYLERAARMRSVTAPAIEYIRKYLRRVEVEPDFAFVPPLAL